MSNHHDMETYGHTEVNLYTFQTLALACGASQFGLFPPSKKHIALAGEETGQSPRALFGTVIKIGALNLLEVTFWSLSP